MKQDYDLSGDIPYHVLESIAFNINAIVDLEQTEWGSPTTPPYPTGAMDYLERANMYLALLKTKLRDEYGKKK